MEEAGVGSVQITTVRIRIQEAPKKTEGTLVASYVTCPEN
jgi:hypothetical protein